MRFLLDTNLLVRAAITPGGLARKLLGCIEGSEEHVLIVSSHILSEVADVLRRPRIQARWPLSTEDIQNYCRYLSEVAQEVPAQPIASVISDPKDQPVIEAAVSGQADGICTSDAHFYEPLVKEFLEEHGISVLTDKALLLLLEKKRG
jgi:putative PIN family toxin of toxin-antitoxin system